MMNITIVSPFRDSENIVPDWLRCIDTIDYPNLKVVMVEGDSQDKTSPILLTLAAERENFTYIRFDTNSKKYPSTVSEERFKHLSKVFNKCLDSVDWEWSDYSLILPSDVMFPSDLVKSLVSANKDLISPYFLKVENNILSFYDVWAFEHLEGGKFAPLPYTYYIQNLPLEPFEVKYIGGAMLLSKTAYMENIRYSKTNVDRGLCEAAREKGYSLYVDPRVCIIHR